MFCQLRSLASSLLVLVLSLGVLPATALAVPGGLSDADVKDARVVKAAEFAVKAHQAELAAKGDKTEVKLAKIVAAKQQVVAGMNYRLTLEVKEGDATRTAEAEVWVREWLKAPEDYKLSKWTYADGK